MRISNWVFKSLPLIAISLPVFAQQAGAGAVLWADRRDLPALSLLDGPGGKTRAPGTNFKFIEESAGGSAAKFLVKDENGIKWKVKLGPEVKSETAATRLLRAAGYFADENYYRNEISVKGMKMLSRGKKYISDGGLVREVRLERVDDGKKSQDWSWYEPRLVGIKEFNGLRVMMALLNNWDLKAENNSLQEQGGSSRRYFVSDLGATFGRTGNNLTRSKGKLQDYAQTKFIKKVHPDRVDFVMRSRPFFLMLVFRPDYYVARTKMQSIVKNVPIADVRWLATQLGELSSAQIADCFSAAGFSPAEVEGYTSVVMQRIDALKKL